MITETIERAQHGDQEAFRELYKEHAARVLGACLRITKNRETAEDMTQEAFLTAYLKLNLFRGDAAFSTWIYRIAVNTIFQKLRRRHLETIPLDEVGDYCKRDLQLEGAVDRIALSQLMQGLGPKSRKVFELHEIEGYEHHEIAAMIGRTAGNSKSQLFKAKAKLRRALKRKRR